MFIFLFLILFIFNTRPILASDNIFGVHLTQPQDIYKAKDIINSSQGDWGWATIVLRIDQLNPQAWQEFFDNCRKFHIIPIIRLATIQNGGNWEKPTQKNIDQIAEFLNFLNWPTQDQHIILFNEINHDSEWGGEINIKEFTDISIYAYQKFKSLNSNFFILSSPLDLAAPENPPQTKSASEVFKEIYQYKPEYFDNIDGLSSHSYPNHGFIGTPADTSQHSIRGYKWEIDYLKSLGIQKTFPVFITETGWPHREGESKDNHFYTAETAANFLKDSLDIWSKDPIIKSVTPFIYNYPYEPFDHFSWVDKKEKIYPQYQKIIDLPKLQNKPSQITKIDVVKIRLPFIIFANTDYVGKIILKNSGQSIWGETENCLTPQTTTNVVLDAICFDKNLVMPNQTKTFSFKFKIIPSQNHSGKTFISWQNLPQFEVTPLNSTATLYHPKTRLGQKLINLLKKIF